MEFVNMFKDALYIALFIAAPVFTLFFFFILLVVWSFLFYVLLFLFKRLAFISKKNEFDKGYDFYPLCLKKIKKEYGILLFFCLAMLLHTAVQFINFEVTIPIKSVFLGTILLGAIFFFHAGVILFSYSVLSCYNLLTRGGGEYKALFSRIGEISLKTAPLLFFYLVMLPLIFVIPYFLLFFLLFPFGVHSFTFFLGSLWVSYASQVILFLLIDKKSYAKAFLVPIRTLFMIFPEIFGVAFGSLCNSLFFIISAFFLLPLYPPLAYCLYFFVCFRILSCVMVFNVAYWLYSRKEQDLPFGKEYIESLEG